MSKINWNRTRHLNKEKEAKYGHGFVHDNGTIVKVKKDSLQKRAEKELQEWSSKLSYNDRKLFS